MQNLIVVCAMLFVAVTPFLSRYDATDAEWSDEPPGADLAEVDVSDSENV